MKIINWTVRAVSIVLFLTAILLPDRTWPWPLVVGVIGLVLLFSDAGILYLRERAAKKDRQPS